MYLKTGKRILDCTIALSTLLVFLTFFIIVAVLIKLDSSGPIFFMQERVGKNLRTFKVYKFRTMTNEKRQISKIIGKDKGVTNIGHYLRRFKIDELPQIINVLKGDMSIVGPRPSIPQQLEQMTEVEKRRYSIRPGLTGLSQVSGNIHLSWKERYKFDLHYINHISFYNDLKIIFRTVLIVLKGEEKFYKKPLSLK